MPNRTIIGGAPLIIFVGPARCGKSMVLMSLVEYLRNNVKRYVIAPNYEYIPNDAAYKGKCDQFMQTLQINAGIRDGYKKPLDGSVDEILLDVRDGKNGPVKFRMLEAPGEDFFSINNPDKPYAQYLNEIISKTRREKYPVYYVMLLDIHTDNNNFNDLTDPTRGAYESRLIEFFDNGYMHSRGDKVVLLYNKIDMAINKHEAIENLLSSFYPDLRDHFKRRVFVFFNVPCYNGVQPYKTGYWEKQENDEGEKSWQYKTDAESEAYAEELWSSLISRL